MTNFNHSIIRAAVWNLAGFTRPGRPIGISARSKKAEKQAEGLALLDAEFVTLIEVSPLSYIETLVEKLKAFGVDYNHTILPQKNGNIHIGFLHKPGIEVTNPRFIEGSEGDYGRGRQALAVDISIAKLKAIVIGVHLKSGRDRDEQKTRDSQCKVIGEHITNIHKTPGLKRRAIFLMGDFNMIPGQDVSNFHYLGGEDVMDFVSSWDLQDRFSHILEKGRANLLDGFAVSRNFSTDYIKGSLRLFPMHWTMDMGREAFRRSVSDHLPFVASFKIY
ncbi:endonuclease/exonuclease/phosphatase family protein [Roseobacter sinensis]|uniref:GMP synthase n=1 Tax=Roseobacter sinensis TaxID=2931391 RepID=A0ABT3BG17_9RHOB|nr:GMP synthase [Roseobacter sp. WL0113]MCV3272531.1 GMP synthase [Roseobacter sp. WL0113]